MVAPVLIPADTQHSQSWINFMSSHSQFPYCIGVNSHPHISLLSYKEPLHETFTGSQIVIDRALQPPLIKVVGPYIHHLQANCYFGVRIARNEDLLNYLQTTLALLYPDKNFQNHINNWFPHFTLGMCASPQDLPDIRPLAVEDYTIQCHLAFGQYADFGRLEKITHTSS